MRETQQVLNIQTPDNRNFISPLTTPSATLLPAASQPKSLTWWIKISFYSFLILAGQSTSVILGRLYYEKGGQSKWMSALVQFAGFPLLIPLYYIFPTKSNQQNGHGQQQQSVKPSVLKLGAVYICLGVLLAFNGMLFSIGILYLPVSTFSLISASQLAFTAFFAFFLVGQKLTPYIVNSLVILTISSILLVFHSEGSGNNGDSKAKYAIGFLCAVGASAGLGLMLPLTQYFFQKVIKKHDFKAILSTIVYELLVANCAAVIGLFASGEWKTLKGEMKVYTLGKVSYLMTLIWSAISWQVFYIGSMKLLIEVSSLFSNVIGTLGLPIVPVLAVFIFHDKMDGIKVVALVLAIWGFVSYAYQCYLDNKRSKPKGEVPI